MPLARAKLSKEAVTPTEKKKIVTEPNHAMVPIKEQNSSSWAWADIEGVLSDEWEIGGLAMTTDEIRALIAGE
jgi:hypothetical protein